jgi:hypothetical protein
MIGAELFLNRSPSPAGDRQHKTDDLVGPHRQARRSPLQVVDAVGAWVPNSWYWEKIENAAKGATDRQGRPYSVPLALSSSVGVKLKPQDVEDAMAFKAAHE